MTHKGPKAPTIVMRQSPDMSKLVHKVFQAWVLHHLQYIDRLRRDDLSFAFVDLNLPLRILDSTKPRLRKRSKLIYRRRLCVLFGERQDSSAASRIILISSFPAISEATSVSFPYAYLPASDRTAHRWQHRNHQIESHGDPLLRGHLREPIPCDQGDQTR